MFALHLGAQKLTKVSTERRQTTKTNEKECGSDVSSRFFWGERYVTSQKTASEETGDYRGVVSLPDFIRRGPGYNRCIMGLTTQDPYIQKEHTELYKILKFRVNWAIIEQDTAIQKR